MDTVYTLKSCWTQNLNSLLLQKLGLSCSNWIVPVKHSDWHLINLQRNLSLNINKLVDHSGHNLYPSVNITEDIQSRRMRTLRRIIWEKCEMNTKYQTETLKWPLDKHKHRCEDNIKMNLKTLDISIYATDMWMMITVSGQLLWTW
jgi:hypothetical protein